MWIPKFKGVVSGDTFSVEIDQGDQMLLYHNGKCLGVARKGLKGAWKCAVSFGNKGKVSLLPIRLFEEAKKNPAN